MDRLVKGDATFAPVFDGPTYLFAERERLDVFESSPTKYVTELRSGRNCNDMERT